MSEDMDLRMAGKNIITWVNFFYGVFLVMLSLYGVIFVFGLGPVLGVILGVILMLVAWMFLKEEKKEGWLYAFIINIAAIAVSVLLIPFPIWVYTVTFSVLIIIIMIVPQFRSVYT